MYIALKFYILFVKIVFMTDEKSAKRKPTNKNNNEQHKIKIGKKNLQENRRKKNGKIDRNERIKEIDTGCNSGDDTSSVYL